MLYISDQSPTMPLNPSHIGTAVERVPSCAWTSSSLALTILKIFSYWLVEELNFFLFQSITKCYSSSIFIISRLEVIR